MKHFASVCYGHLPQVSVFVRGRQHIPETFYFLILCYQVFSFFNVIYFTNFYPTKSKLFFYFYIFWILIYILFWKLAACSLPIPDCLKTPVLLYFEKNSYMIKVGLSPSKKNFLFASMIALQKWWKMLFISF